MTPRKKAVPGLDPVREFPYFKIQYRDEKLCVWRDVQKSFKSLDLLFQYANRKLSRAQETRIMKVTEYGKREILQSYTAFGVALED